MRNSSISGEAKIDNIGNALTAVVVPTTSWELNQLELLFFLWSLPAAANCADEVAETSRVRLIITLDGEDQSGMEATITEAYEFYNLARVFSGIEVNFCRIPPEENIYIRTGQTPPAKIPPLGLKSGPNTQFFRSMTRFCEGQNTVLLNEVDCFPVRADWIGRLQKLVAGGEPFWILGSPYRGWGRIGPEILMHVNGNALYGVGMPGFGTFLREWEAALTEAVKVNPDLAYDIFMAYRHAPLFDPARSGGASIDLFKSLQETLCRIRYTSCIHNVAGDEEISGRKVIDLPAYAESHPELTLVHGRFLKLQVLRKALGKLSPRMVEGGPIRHAIADYLIESSRRLLERDNLDAATEIMRMVQLSAPCASDEN